MVYSAALRLRQYRLRLKLRQSLGGHMQNSLLPQTEFVIR